MTINDHRAHKAANKDGSGRKRSRLRVAFDITLIALLAATLLLLSVALYGITNNRWYKVIGVEGDSMAPTIQRGDLILITRPDDPQVGDIGVFQVNGRLVTHRIIGIGDNGGYVTQGDANAIPDDWGEAEVRLVGIYRFRIPWIGGLLWDSSSG